MSENLSGGYAICFNQWLFDDRIKSQLRLLLLIASLSAKEGYCYASNQYLAEKFKTTPENISRQIGILRDYGYIKTEDEKFGAVVTNRKIKIVAFENLSTSTAVDENDNAVNKNVNRGYQKDQPTVNKNVNGYNMCNNTSHNITSQEYYKPLKSSSLSLANARTREATPADDFSPPVREPAKKFQKPTIEQIKAYCLEAGKNIDAEAFFDFYEAKGWVVGKAPMKDWKAAVRNWAKNESQFLRRKNNDKEDEYADVPMFASDNPILKNNFLSRDMSVIYDKATQIAIEDERLRSSPAQIEMKDHR